MVPANSNGASPTPPYSGYHLSSKLYAYRALTVYGWVSHPIQLRFDSITWSYNPIPAVTDMVWASARSLATTCAITVVFSSSRYLDVSVPWVCLPTSRDNLSSIDWVAPFGHLRINSYLRIPVAFRSLSRPSSPLRA
jgi:hypothetical protein